MKHDIDALASRISALGEAVSKVNDAKHCEVLASMIRRPGFTSVAEYELMHAHLDSINAQVLILHRSLQALTSSVEKIGQS